MHCMSFETFSKLKARSDRTFNNDVPFNGLDSLIHPGLVALNKIPKIVTIFSCSGHESEDQEGRHHSRMYVMFGIYDQTGMDILYSLFSAIRNQLRQIGFNLPCKVDITLTENGSIFERNLHTYPTVIFNTRTSSIDFHKHMHRIFNDVCQSALEEYQQNAH